MCIQSEMKNPTSLRAFLPLQSHSHTRNDIVNIVAADASCATEVIIQTQVDATPEIPSGSGDSNPPGLPTPSDNQCVEYMKDFRKEMLSYFHPLMQKAEENAKTLATHDSDIDYLKVNAVQSKMGFEIFEESYEPC